MIYLLVFGGLALAALLVYTVLVTPARFGQCLDAPLRFVQRFEGDERMTGLPELSAGHTVELLLNGNEILPAMIGSIDAAQTAVRFQVMLFQPDEAGRALAEALAEAGRRGVTVGLAFDRQQSVYGSVVAPYSPEKIARNEAEMARIDALFAASGVRVVNSAPGIDPPQPGNTPAFAIQRSIQQHACINANHYDHRKLLIADETIILGGMNVGSEYLYRLPPTDASGREPWTKWLDTAVRLQGPTLAAAAAEFDWRWEVLGGAALPLPSAGRARGNARAALLAQRPGFPQISSAFLERVEAAESRIVAASPYVSHRVLLEALMQASRRGVAVTLVTPGDANDVPISRDIFRRYTPALLDAGVTLYESNRRMAHFKLMVVDERWLLIGSFNLNHRSVDHDLETAYLIDDVASVEAVMTRLFVPYLAASDRLTTPNALGFNPLHWLITPFS